MLSLPRLRIVDNLLKSAIAIFILLVSMPAYRAAYAQQEAELILGLSRDFGYSSGTGQIQGTFSFRVSGPDNLSRVAFLIDGQIIGEVTEPPFRLQFNTDSYPLGVHTLSAIAYTSDGRELRSADQRREFVPASQGLEAAGKIVVPIIVILGGIMLLSFLLPSLLSRGKTSSLPFGAPRTYGLIGGTICPKCQRPFGMHIFGFNLFVGKLDRCPHCGRWSLVRRVPMDRLKAAEAAELQQAGNLESVPEDTEEEQLRKALENSKYQDL